MEQWLHAQPQRFWHLLGLKRKPASETTFRTQLAKLDPYAFEQSPGGWLPTEPTPATTSKPQGVFPPTDSASVRPYDGRLSRCPKCTAAANVVR